MFLKNEYRMTVQHTEADPPPKLLNQLGPGKDSSALGALKLLLACFCAHGSHSRSSVKQGSTTNCQDQPFISRPYLQARRTKPLPFGTFKLLLHLQLMAAQQLHRTKCTSSEKACHPEPSADVIHDYCVAY